MDVVLALLAAVLFAVYSVSIRVGQRRAPDAQAGAMATLLVAALVAVAVAGVAAPEPPDVGALWPFAAAGIVVPGVSILLYQRSIQLAGASRPTVVIGTAPLLSVLLAAALLDEPLEAAVLAGTTLVVLGSRASATGRPTCRRWGSSSQACARCSSPRATTPCARSYATSTCPRCTPAPPRSSAARPPSPSSSLSAAAAVQVRSGGRCGR
jgi:uncharacterized membrane protein